MRKKNILFHSVLFRLDIYHFRHDTYHFRHDTYHFRHDVYQNQYRAMFVLNCDIDKAQVLKYPKATQTSHKRKKQKGSRPQQAGEENNEDFNPVKCTECNTVVAVYDKDEIYHFFNVLASY